MEELWERYVDARVAFAGNPSDITEAAAISTFSKFATEFIGCPVKAAIEVDELRRNLQKARA